MTDKNAIIFDDDELFCYIATRILKDKNINVASYSSPIEYFCSQSGIDSCPVATQCVGFLITDNKMQDMTGLEFLKRLNQLECKIPNCRRAIISGNWTDDNLKIAKQLVKHVFDKFEAKKVFLQWIEEYGK